MLLLADSFDYIASPTERGWIANYSGGGNYPPSIDAGTGRRGSNSLKINGNYSHLQRSIPGTPATLIAQCSIKPPGAPPTNADSDPAHLFMLWQGGGRGSGTTAQCGLGLLPSMKLAVVRGYREHGTYSILGTTPDAISPFSTCHVGLKITIDNSTGAATVYINGVAVLTLTGLDTQVTANAYADVFTLGHLHNFNYIYNVDDFVLMDDSGSSCNDFLGDRGVYADVNSGAGSNADFTPSTGSNEGNVDDATPNNDTDYNKSPNVGDKDSFVFPDLPDDVDSVDAVCIDIIAKKTDAGSRSLSGYAKSGGSDAVEDDHPLNTDYDHFQGHFTEDPATSAAWLPSAVNDAELGYKVTV
jgi:hypothetical protein